MKLEPCPNPWCVSEVAVFIRKGSLTREAPEQVQIECGCGIYGPACDTEAEAIAAWNRRTPPASQSDDIPRSDAGEEAGEPVASATPASGTDDLPEEEWE